MATIDICLNTIQSGERIQITRPKAFTHFVGTEEYDPDTVEEIRDQYSDPDARINPDTFIMIRYTDLDKEIIIVDIYLI